MCKLTKAKFTGCGHNHDFVNCCPQNAPPGAYGGAPIHSAEKCSNLHKLKEEQDGLCPECTAKLRRGKDAPTTGFIGGLLRRTLSTYKPYLSDGKFAKSEVKETLRDDSPTNRMNSRQTEAGRPHF
jgi:hypothetical protein